MDNFFRLTAKQSPAKFFSSCFFIIISLLISSCSPVKILNTFVPDESYQLIADVPYGDLSRQYLDIYLPSKAHKADVSKEVIVFYYGGSWDSGNKNDYKFVGEAFASKGYIVVIPDYRVYPDVLFPAFMQDPVKAAGWVKSHIKDYGGDGTKMFLSGHSAGAHIAVMLGVNSKYLAQASLKPSDFIGIIGLAGPYDFLPLKSKRLKKIFGPKETRWQSQPIYFADGNNPPMLLAVGLKDQTVWPLNTFNMASKIKEHRGSAEVVKFPDYDHVDMVAKLAKPLRGEGDLLNAITNFMSKQGEVSKTIEN